MIMLNNLGLHTEKQISILKNLECKIAKNSPTKPHMLPRHKCTKC